ncbi:MAG: hypothetical protein IJ323_07020 [Clostridia bacterium]|nr:hypothetical protein [Clostridia bacterium]
MVYANLNNNMEEMLRTIKGAKFISYECGKQFDTAYGNLRINTDTLTIELSNIAKEMPFFNGVEDIACLECKASNSAIEFKPYCIEPFEVFEIDAKIESIEIINDVVNVNDGEYEISFDRAIIFRTDKKDIMFSRDVWFSEVITISENDDYNSVYPVDEVIEVWSDQGENKVNVIRTCRKL